jgi:Reverse transcriptase (RNA-dependent DNA polymerase)
LDISAAFDTDISAAFDTISHSILLRRLETEFGVTGTALSWLQSYSTDRRQYVKLGQHSSDTVLCSSGVPRGSVLGPLLFAAYVSPAGDLIKRHGIDHHTDNTQLFLSIKASSMTADLLKLESCSQAVKAWFAEN